MEKFQTFGIDENATLTAKINSIVQALNQVGRVSNDVVHDWQKVMEWAMGEGLEDAISSNGLYLISPDGSKWKLNVDNDGVLTTTKI